MKTWAMKGVIAGLCGGLIVAPTLDAQRIAALATDVGSQKVSKVNLPGESLGQSSNPIALGYEYLNKGWADAAIKAFQQGIQAQPQSVPAHLGLAQAYQKNGVIESAWQQYQQVLRLQPMNQTALRQIGTMGEYRPDWQVSGIAALTQLLRQVPNDRAAQTQRARLLGFQGKFEQAWADYSQLDPAKMSVDTLLKAAETAGFSGRASIAVGLYDRVLRQAPDNLMAQINRAYFGVQSKQVSEAEATQVLAKWQAQSRREITSAIANLVGVLPANADYQPLYQKVLAKFPQQLPVHQRALQILARQNPAAAKAAVTRLVAANPNVAFAYFIQGNVAKQIGDTEFAAAAYEALVRRQPGRVDAWMALGGLRFEQRRYSEAEVIFRQVLSRDTQNVQVRQVMADLYASQDQPVRALKLLREVQQIQLAQGVRDRQIRDRIDRLQFSSLKRRSFQTPWEGY